MRLDTSLLRGRWTLLVIAIVVLAVLPVAGVPAAWILYLFLFFVYLAMANMWNLLAGYSGLICLAPAAFVGLGGYALVIMTWSGLPFYLGIIAGGIVAAIFAIIISYPLFRLRGIYFAIGTLVVPAALQVVFLLWRPVGGELHGGGAGYMVKGLTGITSADTYWMALAIAAISVYVMRVVLNSKLGLGLAAIRDNDETAGSSGVNVFRTKLYSFVIAAFVTGIAGGVFYTYQGYIEPNSAFSISWLMTLLMATVIGGEGIEDGPIIGTVIVVILHFWLAKYAGLSLLIQGVILVVVMLVVPQGIMGLIRGSRIHRSVWKLITSRR